MRIINYSPKLSFEATLVSTPTINRAEDMLPVNSSIVEIDIKNLNDIGAVANAVKGWGEKDDFGNNIANDLKQAYKNKSFPRRKVYALTSQSNHFDILEGENILGLVETRKTRKGNVEIKHFQVSPKSAYSANSRPYLNIGRRLVDLLKEHHANKQLIAKVFYSAANFYEKMGFEIIDPKQLIYIWKK